MKQMCIFLLLLNIFNIFLCLETLSQSEKFHNKQPSSSLGPTLPDVASYWEGWIHYYHYSNDTTISHPKYFFQNNEFFKQRVPFSVIKKADTYGSLIIPNKSSFYAVLTPETLLIFSTRDDSMKKQTDELRYEFINPIPEDAFLEGGIHDLGNFAIGSCFEIKAKIPNGRDVGDTSSLEKSTWVFCLNKIKDKEKLMKLLIKLKFKQQRKFGEFKTGDSIKMEKKTKNLGDILAKAKTKIPEDDKKSGAVENPTDGFWLLLQNWTSCTLKCGGGQSFQQWRCIPPKNGGKPCVGDAIRIRSCNTQKCPGVNALLNMMKMAEPETLKPIVKVGPFSSRLQKYDKNDLKRN